MITTVLIILLILVMLGAAPVWPYSAGWGWSPIGILFAVLLILLVLGYR